MVLSCFVNPIRLAVCSSSDEFRSREIWQRQAARNAARQNFAWWLDSFLPATIAVSIVFACALLSGRKMAAVLPHAWVWFSLGLLAAALFAWLSARRKFVSPSEALVQIESKLHLHNRLTAAAAGVGD
jgi:hypothetical protein